MTRLEKIVTEQLKRGDIGTAIADSVLISKLKNKFKHGVTVYMFIDKHGIGKKYPPLTADQVINEIPKNKGYKNYSNGEYIFVIDDQNPNSGKKETLWDVYIINKKKTFPNVPDQVFDEYKSGQFNQSVIVTFKQYELLLKKQNELAAAKEKADAEAAAVAAEKKKPAIEKTKDIVQNVITGTETIDVNNLGKGTPDAKAFQELLWKYGNSNTTVKNQEVYKKFAFYRNKGADGGWDGNIGGGTEKYIKFLYGGLKVNTYAELIKKIRSNLSQVQTESINYFKGMGMNIKLKDILREQGVKKKNDEFDLAGALSAIDVGTTTKTKTVTSKKTNNFTEDTFPANYTGKGKITYKNGDTFTGSWKNRKKSGQGIYTYKDGGTYTGSWENGKKSGSGIYKNAAGKSYDGPWSNGLNGEFKVTYPNGDIRVGTYSNSKLNGSATFTKKGGEPVKEMWKDGKLLGSNAHYWTIAKNWVVAEGNFWAKGGKGPEGQKRKLTHTGMFDQYNYTWDDDESGAKSAYLANRRIALQWLKKKLTGCVEVTGQDYYRYIENWIYAIANEIDDVFQNDQTIKLTNAAEGDTITRTVQGEIDT